MPKKNKEKNKRKKEKTAPFMCCPLPFDPGMWKGPDLHRRDDFANAQHLDPTKPLPPVFKAHADDLGLDEYGYRIMFNLPTLPKDIRHVHPDVSITMDTGTRITPGSGCAEERSAKVTFKKGRIVSIVLESKK